MLDIRFIRENPEAVKENIKKKFQEAKLPLVDQVIALDQRGEPAVGWILQGAMPIGYELDPMDSSRSEVLTESITFAITGLERTTEI